MYQITHEGYEVTDRDAGKWRFELRIRDTLTGAEQFGGVEVNTHWSNGWWWEPRCQEALRHLRRELGDTIQKELQGLPYDPHLQLEIEGKQSDAEFALELARAARH